MSFINCIECNKEFSDRSEFCPNCGCPTSYSIKQSKDVPTIGATIQDNTEEHFSIKETKQRLLLNRTSIIAISAIVGLLLIIFLVNLQTQKKAISIVMNSNIESSYSTNDEIIRQWVTDDSNVYQTYGWTAKKVSGSIYFVSFGFDDDKDESNGYQMHCYEADIKSNIVRKISGNTTLEKKYKDLNIIE